MYTGASKNPVLKTQAELFFDSLFYQIKIAKEPYSMTAGDEIIFNFVTDQKENTNNSWHIENIMRYYQKKHLFQFKTQIKYKMFNADAISMKLNDLVILHSGLTFIRVSFFLVGKA